MKAFTLSLILLVLGVTAAAGQSAPTLAANAGPSPKAEPIVEAEATVKDSAAEAGEQPRIATRPPTPLVRK